MRWYAPRCLQNSNVAQKNVCRFIRQWITGLRRDMYVAATVDELLDQMNFFLDHKGYGKLEKVTEGELKECLKHISTIVKDGDDVLWLWGNQLRSRLINKIIEKAAENGAAVVI